MSKEFNLKKFWEENDLCLDLKNKNRPRIPISFWLDDHFLIEDLNPSSTIKYYNDYNYKISLHKIMNKKLEKAISKKFYTEDIVEEPIPNRFEVIMGSHWQLTEGQTPWLESTVNDIGDLKKLIDRINKIDISKEAFPDNWQKDKENYEKKTGKKLLLGGNFSRGPVTMATSIIGTTNVCIFVMTEPEVMSDFFFLLGEKLVEYNKVLMMDTGNDVKEGYSLNDDNCYLFSPALYEKFAAPVLIKVFKEFAPGKDHKRFQHSDSAMGHLMEILRDVGVNQVNFGPTIHPLDIRKAMPDAVIHGQMPPFTLKNGSKQEIIDIVRRDIDTVGKDGNLIECTAGSVIGNTPLENIKLYMWAVQEYGQF